MSIDGSFKELCSKGEQAWVDGGEEEVEPIQ